MGIDLQELIHPGRMAAPGSHVLPLDREAQAGSGGFFCTPPPVGDIVVSEAAAAAAAIATAGAAAP